jgi:signal transduction histidine kinase
MPLVALLWTVIISLSVIQYTREKEYRAEGVYTDLKFINSRIVDAYEQNLNLEPFMSFVAQYYLNSEYNGIRISVYNKSGTLLYCIGEPIVNSRDPNLSPEVKIAENEGSAIVLRRSNTEPGNPYYFFSARRSPDGKILVRTAMPYTEALSRTLDVGGGLWYIIIIFAVIVTGIAYISTRYLGKNVKLLYDFAARAADGEGVANVDEFPHDELGDISRKIVTIYQEKIEANERSEREHQVAIKANDDKIRITQQLVSNINHELKTPVSVVKGYLDTIVAHPDMDEPVKMGFVVKALDHVERLNGMLNDLSSVTRLENGGNGIIRERVDFHELVFSVGSEIESIGLNSGMKFVFNVPLHCEVIGNYNLLYGVIMNLVRNADFHSRGKVCGLNLISEDDKTFRFIFYDDGVGVGEEHLPHLFDRFYRVDKGRSRKVGGTGLGLPIVKNSVMALGGEIMVRNHKPHGLEIEFTLLKYVKKKKEES